MLGSGADDDSETKSDMKTLQVRSSRAEPKLSLCVFCPISFCVSSVALFVVSINVAVIVLPSLTAAMQMVLEKQLQDIIRYTNELENREATMCEPSSSFIPTPCNPAPSVATAASGYFTRTKRSRLKSQVCREPNERAANAFSRLC